MFQIRVGPPGANRGPIHLVEKRRAALRCMANPQTSQFTGNFDRMHPTTSKPGFRSLSRNRALVLDLIALSPRHAYFPAERLFDLGDISELRRTAPRRISWTVLFMKAYSIVAAEHPQLRQAYCRWPWPRLCECVENVAMVAINREFDGGDRLCWGRFISPEQQSIADLQERSMPTRGASGRDFSPAGAAQQLSHASQAIGTVVESKLCEQATSKTARHF